MKIISASTFPIFEKTQQEVPEIPGSFYYLMPDTVLLRNNNPFYFPLHTPDVHCRICVAIKLSKAGKSIAPHFAHRYYSEIGVAIDFYSPALIAQCIASQIPWDMAYSFDNSTAISSALQPIKSLKETVEYSFKLNGETKQTGQLEQFSTYANKVLSGVSQHMAVKIGDLLLLAAPIAGTEIKIGDRLQAYLNENIMIDFYVS
jgi:2-keto-4-pentenoate hydratase/2-oxohepta-3-ene-1,7-dioic acid hydratase in catechol pathway